MRFGHVLKSLLNLCGEKSVQLLFLISITIGTVLGPMLSPGYPLRFDLVTVPGPQLNVDAIGLGDGLPRAVPLDAFTVALSYLFPDAWLGQALAVLALWMAASGCARITPAGAVGKFLAAFAAIWNPFVMEELAIGHVPHLLAYGAIPWIAILGRHYMSDASPATWGRFVLPAAVGSVTPGGGVLVVVAGVASMWSAAPLNSSRTRNGSSALNRSRARRFLIGAGSLLVLQLPWLITGLLAPQATVDNSSSSTAALDAFALRGETGWGRVIDALGLSGLWNASALPDSRFTVMPKFSTILIIILLVLGLIALWRNRDLISPRVAVASLLATGSTFLVATLPVLPGGAWLFSHAVSIVPGFAIFRDGHRWLAIIAIAFAVLAGTSSRIWPGRTPSGQRATGILVALLIVAVLPDLAGGLSGRLRAWHYPEDWYRATSIVNHSSDRSSVLILPWSVFRSYAWTDRQTVLDPAPRMLANESITSHVLIVSGRPLSQEGATAQAIDRMLTDNQLTAPELAELGIGWVFIERGTSGTLPQLPASWKTQMQGPEVTLLQAPQASALPARVGIGRFIGAVGSLASYAILLLASLGLTIRALWKKPSIAGHSNLDL